MRSAASALALAGLMLCALAGCSQRQLDTWKTVSSPGKAIMGMENTHAAAAARLMRYWGLDEPGRDDRKMTATMRLHLAVPECPTCPVFTLWDIEAGLKGYLQARDIEGPGVTEKFRYTQSEDQQGSFDDYAAAIDRGQPVIVTLCYGAEHRDPGIARKREFDCFSVVGIGYVRGPKGEFMIVHDGLTAPLDKDIDARDRVGPLMAGLGNQNGPWQQEGTSIYRWDGQCTNLIMVFFDPGQAAH